MEYLVLNCYLLY